jgi:putative redox protein
MQYTIETGGSRLGAHLYRPATASDDVPALVLCHGFPAGAGGAATSGETYPDLADHLGDQSGWAVLSFNFSGTGASPGQFSLSRWLGDLRAAVDFVLSSGGISGAWIAGSSTGGALAICEAAEDERIRGVATLAAPADFADWAADAGGFLGHCREVGVISDPDFPPDEEAWARELAEIRPVDVAGKIPPRSMLLLQGSDDDVVPVADAEALAEAAGGGTELRVFSGAGHRLRHDPRAIAVLLGWLDRERSRSAL